MWPRGAEQGRGQWGRPGRGGEDERTMWTMWTERAHRPGRRRMPGLAVGTALGIVAVLGACGGDGDAAADEEPRLGETTALAPTTAPLSPVEQAEAAYLELIEVMYRLLTTGPDPSDPELARLATDPVLGHFRDSLATMRAENQIVERGDRTKQTIIDTSMVSSNIVSMQVCAIGNDRTIDRDDGRTVNVGLSARQADVSLIQAASMSWKVRDITTRAIYSDKSECQ